MSIVLTQVAAMNNKFGGSASFTSSPPSSAVVRARYEPDVRGVNRYRHFHSPVAVQSEYAGGSGSGTGGESIDKRSNSKSPRIRRDLPSIDVNNKISDSETKVKFNNNPPVDTWRIRRRRRPSSPSDVNSLADTPANEPGLQGRNFSAVLRRTPSPSSQTILPSISPSRSYTNMSNIAMPSVTNNINPTIKISPEVSIATILRMPSTLNSINWKKYGHKSTVERTTKIGKDSKKETNVQPQIRFENTMESGNTTLELNGSSTRERKKTTNAVGSHSSKLKVKTKTAEFGTQTDIDDPEGRSSLLRSQGSSTSTDLSMPNVDRTPKATQTEQLGFFSKVTSICTENNSDMEQRSELLEIIDSALEETIDRHSRQLANQFIASSARKQAQVWKDAKEFVSTILLPCSIELANRARHCSTKMPYEKAFQMNCQVDEKTHFRHILLFAFNQGQKATEAAREICQVYGEGSMDIRAAQRRFAKFRSGDFCLDDAPRSGRPSECRKCVF